MASASLHLLSEWSFPEAFRGPVVRRYTLTTAHSNHASHLDYEAELNPQQLAVVRAPDGPSLVIAGAGSGKTHTLTWRVASLLERGVPAERILLVTFTNKAARAMTERVNALLGAEVRGLVSGTFHSVANGILRAEAALLDYPRDYTILDAEDASTLMGACIAEIGAEGTPLPATKDLPKPGVLAHLHSLARNTGATLIQILREHSPYFTHIAPLLDLICTRYEARKHEMAVMDFDDLLVNWHTLLTQHPEARDRITGRFDHILVDEYQDTNHLQGELMDLMAAPHGNLMVVGDDCQSIYAFRGADYQNILKFPDRYPACSQLRLEINYRSSPEVLELANRSISYNKNQFEKTLQSARPEGPLPALVGLRDVHQQAEFVCQRIAELIEEGVPLAEIAVLYRSHHHSLELQVELTRRNIPYLVRSGTRFFEQAHIKDVIAYLRFLYNGRDELSFLRFAQRWPSIGARSAQQLWAAISASPDPVAAAADTSVRRLTGRAQASWTRCAHLIGGLAGVRAEGGSPAELIDAILQHHYRDYARTAFEDAESRLADLDQLTVYAAQLDDLDAFLGEIALMTAVSGKELQSGQEVQDAVCLTSIHQAKGLEWRACFVLWLADGHFPSFHAKTPEALEEERRLFYVAATRAKDDLYLCHPFGHQTRDGSISLLRPSPFISELEQPRRLDQEPWERWLIEQLS
jgi:DNA helicase II / ATP-dependent DNA helicase PcrA